MDNTSLSQARAATADSIGAEATIQRMGFRLTSRDLGSVALP